MAHYRTTPTYDTPLIVGDKTHAAYYRWFQDIDLGSPPSSETPITVAGSPFIYSPKSKGVVIVNGGTVSAIALSRSGTFYPTGQTSGAFALAANDQIQVAFSGVPNMVFLPA